MKQLLYILPALIIIACNSSAEKPPAAPATPAKPAKVDVMTLQEQKAHIDSLFKYAAEDEITIYVKQTGKDSLTKVAAKHIPDNVENTITIFRDNMGSIIRISESPYSESGDWFISCNHYFDESSRTFAFEKKTNSFNSKCVDGVLYETMTQYYNPQFKPADYTYKLVDESDRHIVLDSCDIFQFEYQPLPNIEAYLKARAIPSN